MSTQNETPATRGWRVPWSVLGALPLLPVLALAGFVTVRPDLWVVERVVFEGAERADIAELRHLTDLRNGTTVWFADASAAAEGVERHPWVRHAEARLTWSQELHVTVEEHQPVALLTGPTMRYVCKEGLAIAPASTDDLDYPVITGVEDALGELHPDLPRRVILSALELLETASDAGVIPRERVAEVAFSPTRGFAVQISGGARVLFDLEGFDRQVRRLARLQDEGVSLDRPLIIDLAPASVATVRPLEASGGEG